MGEGVTRQGDPPLKAAMAAAVDFERDPPPRAGPMPALAATAIPASFPDELLSGALRVQRKTAIEAAPSQPAESPDKVVICDLI